MDFALLNEWRIYGTHRIWILSELSAHSLVDTCYWMSL